MPGIWIELPKYISSFLRLGGRAAGDHRVVGDGWEVRLTQIEDFAVGSLRVGQVRVDIDGSAAAVARVLAFLEPKLVRAGG